MNYQTNKELICSQIKKAVANDQDIIISYKKYDGTNSERRISNVKYEPLFKGDFDYIIGYCNMRKQERTFKIERISNIRVL